MKPKMILFEGVDRVGKSSTIKELQSRRPRIDVIYDRGAISNLVYNAFYGREVEDENYIDFIPDSKDVVIVYLFASTDTLVERGIKTEGKSLSKDEYEIQKRLFEDKLQFIKKLKPNLRVININTEGISQEETVDLIEEVL